MESRQVFCIWHVLCETPFKKLLQLVCLLFPVYVSFILKFPESGLPVINSYVSPVLDCPTCVAFLPPLFYLSVFPMPIVGSFSSVACVFLSTCFLCPCKSINLFFVPLYLFPDSVCTLGSLENRHFNINLKLNGIIFLTTWEHCLMPCKMPWQTLASLQVQEQ